MAEIYLNKRMKTLSLEGVFLFGVIFVLTFVVLAMILSVAFVNGWTDAPNSVAACVSTGVLPIKKALRIAAFSDFAGSVTIGLLNGKVAERIIDLSLVKGENNIYHVLVFSVMLSVIVFAVSAWYFGFPTSESHAMLAGIFGSSICINKGFNGIDFSEWINTITGLVSSLCIGFLVGMILMKILIRYGRNRIYSKFRNIQIILGALTSFMHGAQDSQKFVAVAITVLCLKADCYSERLKIIVTLLIAITISVGILTSGEKIIKTVGKDLVTLNELQGFSADLSGFICIFILTMLGFPVSTTHIKTSAIMGAGSINGKIDKNTAKGLIASWILTFPVCAILSYSITLFIIK